MKSIKSYLNVFVCSLFIIASLLSPNLGQANTSDNIIYNSKTGDAPKCIVFFNSTDETVGEETKKQLTRLEASIEQSIDNFEAMKTKFLKRCRWEKAFKALGPAEKRKEQRKEKKRALTEADITIMGIISPKKKDIEEYKV